MRVNGAQKERDFPVGQGMNFRARDLRCFGCVAGIGSQIPLLDGNREGLVQNGRNILDGLRRLPGGLHIVIQLLDLDTLDGLQLHSADCRENVRSDCCIIGGDGKRLEPSTVRFQPRFEPFLDGDPAWRLIRSPVDLAQQRRHFLSDGRLRVPVNTAADRLARSGICAYGDTRLR